MGAGDTFLIIQNLFKTNIRLIVFPDYKVTTPLVDVKDIIRTHIKQDLIAKIILVFLSETFSQKLYLCTQYFQNPLSVSLTSPDTKVGT